MVLLENDGGVAEIGRATVSRNVPHGGHAGLGMSIW